MSQVPWDLIVRSRGVDNRIPESPQQAAVMQQTIARRQCTFLSQPIVVGTTPQLIRTREDRTYFMIMNTDAVNSLYVGFDYEPTPANGVVLSSKNAYEPFQVPTNDIWVAGSAAGTTGILIYAIGNNAVY